MGTSITAGLRTAYRVHGAGPAMVLVHGVGLRSEVWDPQVAAFSASHRVVVYDTMGHGHSDPPLRIPPAMHVPTGCSCHPTKP
jgi:pimeloyl-ACP methyl ester carboxylesterase